jgi:hypothetical protein
MNAIDGERRFVLLRHELPEASVRASHYDLMLERASDLFTVELHDALQPGLPQTGRELSPHRKAYLDYEGPLSQDRGEVRAVDRGTLTIVHWTEAKFEGELKGQTLRGRLTLERENPSAPESCNWRVLFDRSL